MHDESIASLEALVRSRPGHADVHAALGHVLHAAARFADAESAFDAALRINPQYAEAVVGRAFAIGERGRAREGYAEFRRLFASMPDEFPLVFALGIYCMRFGWRDTGVAQLRRACELLPNAPFPRLFLAAAYADAGDGAAAARARRVAVDCAVTLRTRSGVTGDASGFADASFHRSWPSPGLTRVHLRRAEQLLQARRGAEAVHELEVANSRFPGHPLLLVETGRFRMLLDGSDDAARWFEAAVAVDPRCHSAHLETSYLIAERGNLDAAIASLRLAVELRPSFPDYRYQLGTLLLDVGRMHEAASQLEQALVFNPTHGHGALALARAYAELGRDDDALALIGSGEWRQWPESLVLSAELLARAARLTEARSELERALRLAPDFPAATEALAALRG